MSWQFSPNSFTSVRDKEPDLSIDYLSPPSNGYRLLVYGEDLQSVMVLVVEDEEPPPGFNGWILN